MAGAAPLARGNDRALRFALLVSVALHAALLLGLPALHESLNAPAAPPLQGRLVEEPAPPVQENPAPPPAPAAKTKARKPALAQPAPERPERTIEPPASEVAAAAPTGEPLGQPVAAPTPAATGSAFPRVDARSVGEYRLELIGAARRHKRYPALARENNWTGQVLVGVSVGAEGKPGISVKGSSGHAVLDQQALDMFGQAAREVPVPPALRGQVFAFDVRAIYGLED